MVKQYTLPLFPLNTVLFPGGPLPLRIFETRYIDMVKDCVKDDAPFGVLLIREGGETGAATTHTVGTLARITDWYQGSDGLLGVTAIGEQRFRVLSRVRRADGLNVGTVELLPDDPEAADRAVLRGQPLPLVAPTSPLTVALAAVADRLSIRSMSEESGSGAPVTPLTSVS